MSDIIEHILKRTDDKAIRNAVSSAKKKKNWKGVTADDLVKVCPDCQKAWEPNKYDRKVTTRGNIFYYEGFVTYKKPRQICPNCKEK